MNADPVRALHAVKDEILAYWDRRTDLPESHRRMMAGDAKEAYYTIVAATEMSEDPQYRASFAHFLEMSRSRFAQAASSIDGELKRRFTEAFDRCWNGLSAQLQKDAPAPRKGLPPVVRVGPRDIHLICHDCGDVAAVFRIATERVQTEQGEMLHYSGTTMASALPLKESELLFPMLDRGDLAGVHGRMMSFKAFEDGMDCWCPTCSRVYCRTHYRVREVYDDGFYDVSMGTCPQGHERELDD